MSTYPSADALLDDAATATGLDDFGPGDFRAGLAELLDSLERDGDVDPGAVDAYVVSGLRRRLRNRLEVEAWYRDHAEIEELAVRGPVDINGLPRTGTTALANMLSLDPQFRCLRQWEQMQPSPPPQLEDEFDDPRRRAEVEQIASYSDDVKAMHLFDIDATSEDVEVLGMAFHGQQGTWPVPTYRTWWRGTDMTDAYRYHRRVVVLLQSRRPPDLWLFKAPHHNFHLEAFATAYPDARFVMTHRDPAKAVPSWISICAALMPPAERERDLPALGRELCEHLRAGVEHAIAARAVLGEDRFLDVHHRAMIADPMGTVARVYDFLGYELTAATEAALAEWQDANRSGAHGTHRYTAEQFGLTIEQVHADFADYIRHYDVQLEC
jgi:hypothetical protein